MNNFNIFYKILLFFFAVIIFSLFFYPYAPQGTIYTQETDLLLNKTMNITYSFQNTTLEIQNSLQQFSGNPLDVAYITFLGIKAGIDLMVMLISAPIILFVGQDSFVYASLRNLGIEGPVAQIVGIIIMAISFYFLIVVADKILQILSGKELV